jgi:hypothetical protein
MSKKYIDEQTGIHMIVHDDKNEIIFTHVNDIEDTKAAITRLQQQAGLLSTSYEETINTIIKCFNDAGFTVHLRSHGKLIVLAIRTRVGNEIVGIDWAIAPIDLERLPYSLSDETDRRITQLKQAMAEKQAGKQ